MAGKKERNGEIPGNAVGSQQLFEAQMYRAAATMVHVEGALERLWDEDIAVARVVIRVPEGENGEYLAVVNATDGHDKVVAFHRAGTFKDVITGLCERLVNGSLKWSPDKFG